MKNRAGIMGNLNSQSDSLLVSKSHHDRKAQKSAGLTLWSGSVAHGRRIERLAGTARPTRMDTLWSFC